MPDPAKSQPPTAGFWRAVSAIVWKDLAAELRNKEIVSALVVFSLLVILIFNFALELDKAVRENVAAGVLWVTFVFSATLGLNRTFAPEKDRGSLDGLLLAPIDRSALYFGKLLSTFVFILIVEIIVIPAFSVLYNISLFSPPFLLVVLLGTLGYAMVGTLLAAMAVHTRAREVMLPILLFPVAVPVVMASVRASASILAGAEWGHIAGAFNLVVVYDTIMLAIAIMTFDYLIEE
ncbi:MAG: heme exporter protein CcmB [Anaerolineales bacterium]|jgi:heme exporter protein B|nr:heme exporter protein CcmB [Anaerolineales bacterium]HJO32660.1 heme exporter protein CcmB [Anaerolineales bacterium]